MDMVALFCDLDDFYPTFASAWQRQLLPAPDQPRCHRTCRFSASEMMMLLVAFQTSRYRIFKHFYLDQVCRQWRAEFPHLLSYQRLVDCLPAALVPLAVYLRGRLERTQGIAFVDSLPLPVWSQLRNPFCYLRSDGGADGRCPVS